MLVIVPLFAAALLVCASGLARAADVIGVEICSPIELYPVKWARPGSTITVMTCVTVDGNAWVYVGAVVGDSVGTSLTRYVKVPPGQSMFSLPVTLPDNTADGSKQVVVMAGVDSVGATIKTAIESDAVYVDATPPRG